MTKFKGRLWAASIHFCVSATVFLAAIIAMLLAWYPAPYFFADGGWQITRLAASVDLVLGPLLTLVVYEAGKPNLSRDLTLIGTLQIGVLIYGGVLMYQQRPAFAVFGEGQFQTVTHSQIKDTGKTGAELEALATNERSPPMVFISLPDDHRKRQEFIFDIMRQERQIYYAVSRLYQPMTKKNKQTVLKSAHNIADYTASDVAAHEKLRKFLNKHGGREMDYAFIPLICRYDRLFLGLRKSDATVVGGLNITPKIQ